MFFRNVLLAVVVFVVTGCAANVTRGSSETALSRVPPRAAMKLVLQVGGSDPSIRSSDWKDFKREWSENFAAQAAQAALAGVPFAMQEGVARPTGEDGTLLSVHVDDFRFIRPGTRYAVGVMTGNAYIESILTFRDLKTGEVFATQTANTTSSAWQGVFSPMTNKQVEAIAVDVFRQIKAGQVVQK